MAGDFGQRIQDLIDQVGDGELKASLVVDQRYAAIQEVDTTLRHPRGGQAHYLSEPLTQRHRRYYGDVADAVLGGDVTQAMADAVEDLSEAVEQLAPREFHDLRHSGHPTVADDGQTVYDRPPKVARLTETQLREKARRRGHSV